ncbi:MAG: hypothetical protein OCD01_01765 [Fibrobacterales bacterium]
MHFEIRELPVRNGNVPKITYIVTFDNSVFFSKELTRHLFLQQASGYEYDDIVWGGVLKEDGTWERKSFDFGDAPTHTDRDVVVSLINGSL